MRPAIQAAPRAVRMYTIHVEQILIEVAMSQIIQDNFQHEPEEPHEAEEAVPFS